jgi:hypothetical protein
MTVAKTEKCWNKTLTIRKLFWVLNLNLVFWCKLKPTFDLLLQQQQKKKKKDSWQQRQQFSATLVSVVKQFGALYLFCFCSLHFILNCNVLKRINESR